MNDDNILKGAARAAREAAKRDPLGQDWDLVSAGELSEAELQALRDGCADAQLAARAEVAFRPLDADDRAQFVAAAMAARARAARPTTREDDGAQPAADADATSSPRGLASVPTAHADNVVPLKPRVSRNTWVYGLAASAVLAVGVAMSTTLFGPGGDGALPGYGYELRGTAEVRSATTQSVRADQSFELILTPETALTSAAEVRLFVDTGQALLPVEVTALTVAPSGAARLTAAAAQLPPGEVSLVAVISRGAWPGRESLDAGSDDWRVVRIPLTVVPAAP